MSVLNYNICKINLLLWTMTVPCILAGQSESGDSIFENFLTKDTVISESILKTPELHVENTPLNVSSNSPTIPMSIPGIKQPDFMMPPKYWGYEDAKNLFRYSDPGFEPGKLNLKLILPPQKNILDLIRENPFKALIYGMATLAGMANNTVVGEDKMNKIRLDNMVQSRLGVPETAISGNGSIIYEIDIKKYK
jgi:hypothetical protein